MIANDRKHMASLIDDRMNRPRSAPRSFVPIDSESSLSEVADIVMPEILSAMHRRDTSVTCKVLCARVCALWSRMEKSAKGNVRSKVCEVLHEAAKEEFSPYLRWKRANDACVVELTSNPIEFKADKRTTTFKRMLRLMQDFKTRLITGRKRDAMLFDELDT